MTWQMVRPSRRHNSGSVISRSGVSPDRNAVSSVGSSSTTSISWLAPEDRHDPAWGEVPF
jgi:hypothetical protein